jgi:predicted DNA-binding transcriptional regulator YafY
MRRADRLFQIVQYLRGGRLVTARTLGQRLEVSERTIYRDIADLQASGVPIDGEAGVGYLMREGYDMPPLMFNRAEIVALVVGARLIRAWGGAKMALAATEALNKIETMLPPEAKKAAGEISIHAFDLTMGERQRADLDRIEAAINARQVLKVRYVDEEGRETERDIEPLGLYFWGKVWTLIAWCRLRTGFRMFRVDRMTELAATGETIVPAKGRTLQDYLAQVSEAGGHGPPPGIRGSGITP